MSIKFNCPHCRRSLKVSTELAGKRARCPGCQRVLTIPTLEPAPADVEELAAAALVDQPKPEPEPAKRAAAPVKLTCFYCDEEVQVDAELAGKQTPCPSCRRIIKVPEPVKNEPRDWRKATPRGPAAGLRRDEPPPPEGAWGTATSASSVSRQSLIEADAIPMAEEEGITPAQWAVRGLVGAAAVLLVGAGTWTVFHLRGQNLQNKALKQALQYVPEKADSSLSNLDAAEINRAAAEYYAHDAQPGPAHQQLMQAQTRLRNAANGKAAADRDARAIDLALTQIDLFGSQEEADRGRCVAWNKAGRPLEPTMKILSSWEARTEGLRLISRKLIQKGQVDLAETVACYLITDNPDRPEMLALVGLELVRAGRQPDAERFADKALESYGPDNPTQPIAPSLLALLTALKQEKRIAEDLRMSTPRPDVPNPPLAVRLGFAQGWAFQGEWDAARRLATAPGAPLEQWNALLAVAAVAGDRQPEEARKSLEPALALLGKELSVQGVDPWALLRLVQLGAQAGLADKVRAVADAETFPDPSLRRRAQLAVWKATLKDQADSEALDAQAKQEKPDPLTLEWLARQNARLGNGSAILQAVASWEPETLRAFGYIGAALGMQDSAK